LSKFLKIDELIDSVTEYVRIKIELVKLNMIEELSGILAQLIALFLILTVFMFFMFFGSITLSTFLNYLWSSAYLGYGAVTCFYLLALLFFVYLLQSGKLKDAVENQITKAMKEKEALTEKSIEEDE
tara:strand:+ start:13778 stop:14158 length:381 start_codon:yes stop_codon:yes gene_type:complete